MKSISIIIGTLFLLGIAINLFSNQPKSSWFNKQNDNIGLYFTVIESICNTHNIKKTNTSYNIYHNTSPSSTQQKKLTSCVKEVMSKYSPSDIQNMIHNNSKDIPSNDMLDIVKISNKYY